MTKKSDPLSRKALREHRAVHDSKKAEREQIEVAAANIKQMSREEREQLAHRIRLDYVSGSVFAKATGAPTIIKSPDYYGPRNVEELHSCVKAVFRITIPYTNCWDHTCSPMEWFASVYFGWAKRSVALAARGSGKTFLGSIKHTLWNTYMPNTWAVHAAASKNQAKVASTYLRDFAKNNRALKEVFTKDVGKYEANWKNGSLWTIVTGNLSGVSGQHPQRASWDEIEFWDIEAIEQTWAVPVASGDNPMVWAAFSTRQRSFGAMNWLMDVAAERNVITYTWTVFETMQRCKTCVAIDNAPHGSDAQRMKHCNLWEDCHGLRGTRSSGWIKREDVCELKQSMSKRAWETQGLCLKPSSHGLVLNNFEHSYAPLGNYSKWEYDPELPWYAIHDPSEGKKSVIYYVQIDNADRVHLFGELISPSCPSTNHAKAEFYEDCLMRGYGDPDVIVVDPHRTDAKADWELGSMLGEGINHKYRATCPPIDEKSGGQLLFKTIEQLRKKICDGSGTRRFFINPVNCPGAVKGVREYHYPTDMNNNITSDTPDKAWSDEVDPMRYLVMWMRNTLGHVRIRRI